MRLPVDVRGASGQPYPAEPLTLRGTFDGTGKCTLTTSPVPFGAHRLIDYLTTTADGTAVSLVVYVGDPANGTVFDGTTAGTSAVAAYIPARIVPQGEVLTAVWTGGPAGGQCRLRIEYRQQLDVT